MGRAKYWPKLGMSVFVRNLYYSCRPKADRGLMELPTIKDKVRIAIACFRSNDSGLLNFDELDVPERPISHRLGFYMLSLFNDYDVDCEYNKHLEGKKEEGIPDIVVHKRKNDENNLLAVEVKARRNRQEAETALERSKIREDYDKLVAYTTEGEGKLGYSYGAFVLVLRDEEPIIEWFEKGTPGRPMQSLLFETR